RGVVSSREIERLCRENMVMMALSADRQPHFTKIADFISSMSEDVTALIRDVLLYYDELGLIRKDLFAIDGCKLPSNASKEWSGKKEELKKKGRKMEQTVHYLLKKHHETDLKA